MSEHTSGDWTVDDSGNVFAPKGRLVANCAGWQNSVRPSRKENDANARLIAAAPELLAACEGILYAFDLDRAAMPAMIGKMQEAVAAAKPHHQPRGER